MYKLTVTFVRMYVAALQLRAFHDRIIDVWANIRKTEDTLA
jgi:hypothetical protein